MSEQTRFSNREILNSALLSSMAYKEDQYMYDLHVLQDEHIPKDRIKFIRNNFNKNDNKEKNKQHI